MKINLKISSWASKNKALSILLIVVFEFVRIFIGVKLGKALNATVSTYELLIVCILLFSLIFTMQSRFEKRYSHFHKKLRYSYLVKYNTIIFLSSFLLSVVFGTHLHTLEYPAKSSQQLLAFEHKTNSDSTKHALLKQALENEHNSTMKSEEKHLMQVGGYYIFCFSCSVWY